MSAMDHFITEAVSSLGKYVGLSRLQVTCRCHKNQNRNCGKSQKDNDFQIRVWAQHQTLNRDGGLTPASRMPEWVEQQLPRLSLTIALEACQIHDTSHGPAFSSLAA